MAQSRRHDLPGETGEAAPVPFNPWADSPVNSSRPNAFDEPDKVGEAEERHLLQVLAVIGMLVILTCVLVIDKMISDGHL